MDVRQGWVERFHGDEIIVDLHRLELVQKALSDLGVGLDGRKVEKNEALGLARLSGLTGIEDAVHPLLGDETGDGQLKAYRTERHQAYWARRAPENFEAPDLDLLIKAVQLRIDQKIPGLQVAIGKNYRPSLLRAYPHTDGGGEGEPTSTTERFTGPIDETGQDPEAGYGVRVGLLDTRLAPHPQLTARYIGRLDDLLPTGQHEPTEFDGHCTFIASCILQQAPAAELRLRHVLDSQGEGTAWEAAVAIAELVPLRLDVVNLSLGEYMTDDDSTPMVLERAVEQLGDDTVVVAAAGNNGDVDNHPLANMPAGVTPSTVSYPAALTKVVAVGALDAYNHRAPFTPKEPEDMRWIELLARGADVNAAYLYGTVQLPGGRTEKFEGTANWAGCSFAAGVVTGAIAARTEPGQRSARQALNQLESSLRQQGQRGLLIN